MSCNRAQETDLLAFFADPRSEELAEFRDHYPVCADCSCEVRAWSEVDALLREAAAEHPEAADLLRFESQPGSFDSAGRARLASHLEGCPSCRDEAGAIRTFLASQTSRSAVPAATPDASRSSEAPGWLETLRAALWSPAFAYGLLVVLCVPLLSDYWSEGPTATFERIDDAAVPAQKSQRVAPEPDRSDSAEPQVEPARAPEVAPAQGVSDPKKQARVDLRSEAAARQQVKREAVAPPQQEMDSPASKPAELREYEAFADRAPELELRKRSRLSQETSGQIAMESDAADSGLRASASAEPQKSPVSVLREGERYRIRVRNELALQPGARVELRLIQADGARALVERVKAEAEVFEIRVPVSWLAVGAHQIEVRDVDANAVLARYPLSIP